MKVCITQLQPIFAASKSDPYKHYEIMLRPVDSTYPKCNCPAFAIARNRARKGLTEKNVDVEAQCKHVKEALKTACLWTGEAGRAVTSASGEEQEFCPNCGSEAVEEGAPVVLEPVPVMEGPAPVIGMPELRPMLAAEIAIDKTCRKEDGTLKTGKRCDACVACHTESDSWYAQQKIDGHRVLIHVQGGKLMVLGRSGQSSQHAARFEQPYYADIKRLPDCVIDGELVGDTFWVFDLPHLEITNLEAASVSIDSPYLERYEALEKLFTIWSPNDAYRLLPTATTEVEKAEMAVNCLRAGGEGLMFKELTGTYKPGGRVRTVLKAKFVKSADCIVTKVGTGGKENYTLAVYRDGKLVEVGRCSAIGKAVVEAGTVIEVKYLNMAVNDRLYQPRMLKVRTDKAPEECLWSQFDHARVNKAVL